MIRALALITIFVNHVPGNPFEALTSKNFGFSDAAEAFVLISGVSAGLAYGLKFRPGARLATTLKMWRRVGVLYIAQLGTTMATLAIFSFFALHYGAPELLEKINIGPVMEDTAAALVGIVTFGHQLGYNNILSMYGGGFSTIPAYLADMFGTMHVGGIHGRILTAWSAAGVLGPLAITSLRDMSVGRAISDLAGRVDPETFAQKFGAPMDQLDQLVAAKTVTVARLMEIAPEGTIDPTPSLYNTTMYAMAGLLVIAFFANLLLRPVNARHHYREAAQPAE